MLTSRQSLWRFHYLMMDALSSPSNGDRSSVPYCSNVQVVNWKMGRPQKTLYDVSYPKR